MLQCGVQSELLNDKNTLLVLIYLFQVPRAQRGKEKIAIPKLGMENKLSTATEI